MRINLLVRRLPKTSPSPTAANREYMRSHEAHTPVRRQRGPRVVLA